MYLEIINSSPKINKLEFDVGNQNEDLTPIINGLRRICYSEVKIVAVDHLEIDIKKNTSPLHDQFIAKRLSFIPLNVNPEEYSQYELKIHNPKDPEKAFVNKKDHPIEFYSSMIKVYKNDKLVQENIFIGDSILFILKPEQEFFMTCKLNYDCVKNGLIDNKNKAGSNYQPVCQAAFKYKIDPARRIDPDYEFIDDERNYLKNNDFPTGFIFKIETMGSDYFKPFNVFNNAIDILLNKVKKTKVYILSNGDKNFLKIEKDENIDNMKIFSFLFGEDHTLGNILSSKVEELQKKIGDSRKNFSTYCIPHQLLPKMEVKIRNDEAKIKLSPEEILVKAIDEIISELDEVKKLFNTKFDKFHNDKLKGK